MIYKYLQILAILGTVLAFGLALSGCQVTIVSAPHSSFEIQDSGDTQQTFHTKSLEVLP